ncbi:MAG TPA: hypothetical protein VLQ93_05720, partial [Myxococcaceae bacterium]|nr:hypothetical protein [Myxococcaceae bacterium]
MLEDSSAYTSPAWSGSWSSRWPNRWPTQPAPTPTEPAPAPTEPAPAPTQPAPAPSGSPVLLPIEVIGNEGFTRTVTISLSAQDAQQPLRLWMQAHNLNYADKGSIRFNNGPWVNLNNTTVAVEGMGKAFGGIGGAFATLKLSLEVPAGQLAAGNNQVSFRFNQTDGRSIGFRVLQFNLLLPDGSRLLEDSVFTQDDPAGWEPPFSDTASIAEGEQLWRTRDLVSSYRDGQPIKARCMDCHAQDGRDLKYFNYSNHVIVERSKFHGLTEEEGKKIASYIRTLPGVPDPGRPWNPPYQPGPGLDAKPATQWSAGAGVDAVLEKDRDMLPYLFPNGITAAAISTTTNLSAREVPIMFQLPDWNHWLPRIHPKDAWGDAFVNDPLNKYYAGEGTAPNIPASVRELAAQVRDAGYGNYREKLFYPNRAWVLAVYKFLSPRYPDATTSKDEEYSKKVYSTGLWHMVKTWEVMQEFGLEDHLRKLFPSSRDARGWMLNNSFDTSPNLMKLPRELPGINDNSKVQFPYFSMAWYQLALILYNGNHTDGADRGAQRPLDWSYVPGFIREMQTVGEGAPPTNALLTEWLVKGMQATANSLKPNAPSGMGWVPRVAGDPSRLVAPGHMTGWTDMTAEERRAIMQAVLTAWWEKSRTYAVEDWLNGGGADQTEVINGWYDGSLGNRIWFMLPQFKHHGVDPKLVDTIADWAQKVWPQADWSEVKRATCKPQLHYFICSSE